MSGEVGRIRGVVWVGELCTLTFIVGLHVLDEYLDIVDVLMT